MKSSHKYIFYFYPDTERKKGLFLFFNRVRDGKTFARTLCEIMIIKKFFEELVTQNETDRKTTENR